MKTCESCKHLFITERGQRYTMIYCYVRGGEGIENISELKEENDCDGWEGIENISELKEENDCDGWESR